MENELLDYAGFDGLNNFKKSRIPCTQQEWVVLLPNRDSETFNSRRDAEVFASFCLCTNMFLDLKMKRV